jgi:mannosyltransferase
MPKLSLVMRRVRKSEAGVSAAIFVAAFIVLYFGSWWPSYWSDEAATVAASSLPSHHLNELTAHKDAVHHVYYIIVQAWGAVFGFSEAATRGLSAIAAAAGAAGLAAIGRTLNGQAFGVTAASLFVAMPRTTWMAVEARSFALSAAAAIFATLTLLIAAKSGRIAWWSVYAATSLVAVYVFMYALLLLPVHGIYILARQRARVRAFAAAVVVIVALAIPLVVRVEAQKSQISWLSEQANVSIWSVLVEPYFESSWLVASLFILGFLFALTSAMRVSGWRAALPVGRSPEMFLGLVWAGVPLLALVIADAVAGPLYLARYLSFCVPGVALIAAGLVIRMTRRRTRALLVALVIVSAIPTYIAQRASFSKNGGSDLREVATYLNAETEAGDAIYFDSRGPVTLKPRLAKLAYPDAFEDLDDVALRVPFYETGSFTDKTAPLAELGDDLAAVDRLWVASGRGVGLGAVDPDGALERAGLKVSYVREFNRTQVILLTR